ncbi:uncharacterized protein LOC112569645 [Pomacea canaliculata]|uniref:uncharacterized protein LOC112569645 n=1 Tax=Pomacea canaliculata TaxID=400727 RepID=UPI000D73332D|nr:uncharacterized protein LOC112569645 [Pomacea canaliculata]
MAIEWLRCGHDVYIVSTWMGSRAACIMLHYLLLQTVNTQQSAGVSHGQLHLMQYDLDDSEDVEKAVNDLSQEAIGRSLYVIADEVGSELRINNFGTFCNKLLTQVPSLHLWAASCFPEHRPAGWEVKYLSTPLRSPPVVVTEVEQDLRITRFRDVDPNSQQGVPDHTDSPSVTRLYHRGLGHSGRWPGDCVTCGREVASFLHRLSVGVTETSTTTSTTLTSTIGSSPPPCLQWRDVLVFSWRDVNDQSGVVTGLNKAGIPARVMKDDDIEDVATAHSDVVWVTNARVYGLKRKVVVYLQYFDFDSMRFTEFYQGSDCSSRLDLVPRSTSQLVIVSLY